MLWTLLLLHVVSVAAFKTPCQNNQTAELYKFCDTNLSVNDRVHNLVGMLHLEEKAGLFGNSAAGVDRLGIGDYQWWSEALHGVARSPGVTFGEQVPYVTSFPQVIISASSFNVSLFNALGRAISTEARAMNNVGQAGLTFWTPNVNIFRDPRWGRGQETPGEDPKLTSDYAEHYVRGLQEDVLDPSHLKVSACCKHYWGYDMENTGYNRVAYNAQISKQDQAETYMPPFERCVREGKASSIMCSYNANNGIPSCADRQALTTKLRGDWGFDGYITGDCGAASAVLNSHSFTANPEQTVSAVFNAGMDIDCANFVPPVVEHAVKTGYITEELLDERLFQLFRVQFRLGMFDPTNEQPFRTIGVDHVRSPEHLELAKDAARQGMVLLKNNQQALPLNAEDKIALLGPLASDTGTPLGNYFGVPAKVWSPMEGIQHFATSKVQFEQVLESVLGTNKTNFQKAEQLVRTSKVVILILGINQSVEGEARDRRFITFPGAQKDLAIMAAETAKQQNPDNKVVLVVASGGCLDLGFAKTNDSFDSILWMGYGGEFAGLVLGEILFGQINPSGRLTQTFYPEDYVNQVSMLDMRMRPDPGLLTPGRGYRFYIPEPLYSFGHGLSYASFDHRLQQVYLPPDTRSFVQLNNNGVAVCHESINDVSHHELTFQVLLKVRNRSENQHNVAGTQVVLGFLDTPQAEMKRKLVTYERTSVLSPGQSQLLHLHVRVGDLLHHDAKGFLSAPSPAVATLSLADGDILVPVEYGCFSSYTRGGAGLEFG